MTTDIPTTKKPLFFRLSITFDIFSIAVDDGAILDINLENFLYPPPNGYEKIMVEQSLL